MLEEASSHVFLLLHPSDSSMQGRTAAFLGPCGPREVTAEKVVSVFQHGVKGVVGRAGVKEI